MNLLLSMRWARPSWCDGSGQSWRSRTWHEGGYARVYSCFLQEGRTVDHTLETNRGVYLYVLEGGPIRLNGHRIVHLGAAKVIEEPRVTIQAESDSELLLVDVLLT